MAGLLHGHEAQLRELRSFAPEVYLAVSLRRPSARWEPGCCAAPIARAGGLEALFGVAAAAPIAGAEIEALIVAEERAFRRAEACLPVASGDDA